MTRARLGRWTLAVGSCLVALVVAIATLAAQQPVSTARIEASAKEPQNWLTYSGHYNGQRYSTLDQITPANVKNLNLEWVFQVRSLGAADKFEATPIVVDGVLVEPGDIIVADADGVLVIPRGLLLKTVEGAEKRAAMEVEFRAKIAEGARPMDLLGIRANIDKAGIAIREGTWQDDC